MSLLMTDANGVGGLAIARSLGKQGIEVTASSAKKDAICFHSKYVRNKLIYPDIYLGPSAKKNFLNWLLEELSTKNYGVFFPIDEPILLAVAENIEKISRYTHLVMPELDALQTAVDKSKLTKFAIKHNLSVPKTYFYEELIDFSDYDFSQIFEEIGSPLIIKPYTGAGAKGQVLVYAGENIREIFTANVANHGPCMIQEFIRGTIYNAAFIFNSESKLRSTYIGKTVRQFPVSGGVSVCVETVVDNGVLEPCVKLLRKLGYKGVCMVDVIRDRVDGKVKILELNPRFYASVCLPIAAKVDFPYLLYRLSIDGDIERNLSYEPGVRCRHLYGDFKHMLTILKQGQAENYSFSRGQTIVNFLKFHRDNGYYDWSLDDPKPFLSLPINLVKKRVQKR